MRRLSILLFMSMPCWASLTTTYISQSGAGSADGTSCANARAVSFFNTAGNWGAGGSQIGAGTTVRLCGTFTGSAGGSMLTFQGSGSSGNPITVLFETDALFTATYWSDAIICDAKNFLVIDGGVNGTIRTTANGTALANQEDSTGVVVNGCSNVEIKNLNIGPMYVRTPNSLDFTGGSNGIYVGVSGGGSFTGSNNSFHNNTISDMEYGIFYGYAATQTVNTSIYSNSIGRTSTGVVFGDRDVNSSAATVLIYNNDIFDNYYWASPDGNELFHNDGIHTWATNSGSTTTGMQVYNNYIHGDMGNKCSGFIYLSAAGGSNNSAKIYNNVLVSTVSAATDGHIFLHSMDNTEIYNNTIIGPSGSFFNAIAVETTSSGTIIKNNILSGVRSAIYVDGTANISTSDFNHIECTGNLSACMIYQDNFQTLAQWRSSHGWDNSSIGPSSDPGVDGTYHLLSGSTAINVGANLSALGITALNVDRDGVARPGGASAWDIGAYEFTTGGPTAPTVTTTAASSITTTTASSGGNVTADGGASVTARGVCRSLSANPTTSDTCTSDGTGTGAFASSLTGMTSNTLYHIRAFATNSVGTAYGSDLTFTTAINPPTNLTGVVQVQGVAVIQ